MDTFMRELAGVFAAHGKTPATGRVADAIFVRVRDYPDAFMVWAGKQLADYERLPQNLGLEFQRALYPRWRAETGQGAPGRKCCHECDPRLPGFFFAWTRDEDGGPRGFTVRCLCNEDPSLGKTPRMSRMHARERGYAVMPLGFPGGPAAFERRMTEKGGVSLEREGEGK